MKTDLDYWLNPVAVAATDEAIAAAPYKVSGTCSGRYSLFAQEGSATETSDFDCVLPTAIRNSSRIFPSSVRKPHASSPRSLA